MKKRIFAYVLIFAMLLSFAACAPTDKTDRNDIQAEVWAAIETGSRVHYGRYPQSDLGTEQPAGRKGVDWVAATDKRDGETHYYAIEPIVWQVLSNENGRLFLMSEKALEYHAYHMADEKIAWENSTMRKWLNGDDSIYGDGGFINRAFSVEERAAISDTEVLNKVINDEGISGGNNTTDKLFLLSENEVKTTAYGFAENNEDEETRKAQTTAFARNTGTGRDDDPGVWWLRSPGYRVLEAAVVTHYGDVYGRGYTATCDNLAVRPALNLDLLELNSDLASSFLQAVQKKREKLSELSEEKSLEFITSNGIEIPVELNHEETIGTFVKELIFRAEKMPDTPRPFAARAPIYLAESIRKAVNEHYGIECDNYNIEWDSSFALSFEERVKGQQILSELSDAECIAFLLEHGIALQNTQESDHYGEFIKELVTRIEKYPYAPVPYNDIDVLYLIENIQKIVNEYYDIYNKKPSLSELPEKERLEFVISRGIEIPPSLNINSIGELVKNMIARAEENAHSSSYYYPIYAAFDAHYLAANIQDAVKKYYKDHEKPKLSELSEEECLEFIASCHIKIPDSLKDGYTVALVSSMLERANKYPYYPLPDDGTDESILYESIAKAVIEYYNMSDEKAKLSEISDAECFALLASNGIVIPTALRSTYMGELIKRMIAEAEEHPYLYLNGNELFFVYRSESIRKVVNEYYGIYEEPKLSELSEEECIEFVTSCAIRIPYGMDGDNFGERLKEIILQTEESPWAHSGLSATFHTYLHDVIRKAVNEYYGIRYDNYNLEWRPEFEAGYYENSLSSETE